VDRRPETSCACGPAMIMAVLCVIVGVKLIGDAITRFST
jgi:hypothetical protein